MNSRIFVRFILPLAILLISSCSFRPAQCPLCEREIHEHMQVSITHNGSPMKTCCMSCAMTFQAQNKDVQIVKVTDFNSNAAIDPGQASYVVNSDISPCTQDMKTQKFIRGEHTALFACYDRCSPGILAFRSKREAEEFRKQHGGEIASMDELSPFIPAAGGHHHDR